MEVENNGDISRTSGTDNLEDEGSAELTRSQESNTTSSSATSRKSSIQEKLRKSGSFISRLNNSGKHEQTKDSNNLPSTLANALSSISSFTSNFSLSGASTFNGSQNDNYHNRSSTSSANLTIETASISTKISQSTESKVDVFRRKAALERKNLINLTKLIVKDLISSSLVNGRTIENECQSAIHLNNYFTLIDRVLKHGLMQNLLSNRSASLWSVLDCLSNQMKESTLMSESIRSLAHTKTPDGKIKAWMRLAMMQKKLPEYFNELIGQKDALLRDIYHDYAFMLNDEAHVFAGLIIGVNVIDCNFFVKDDNFDIMDEIIDLSPYLRAASSFDEEDGANLSFSESTHPIDQIGDSQTSKNNITKILDQKNYLEEWNKHLESTISNLQAKMKSIEEQNSRLEMEMKVSEARIAKLQEKRSETLSLTQAAGVTAAGDSSAKSAGVMPISSAIKSMIDRSTSKLTTSDSDTQAATATAAAIGSVSDQSDTSRSDKMKNKTLPTGRASEEPSNASTRSQTQADDAKLADLSPSDRAQPETARLVAEVESYKNTVSEKEAELVSLRERITILESSYRSALDKIRILERDLDIQTSMNSDKDTTIKIYEKDIREKQQQVESLRASLADAKKLNSDLSDRLNETSAKLKDRLKSVSQLQASLDKWKLENKTLAGRLHDKQKESSALSKDLEKALEQAKELKKYNEKINDELRKERECGQSSSVTVEEQNIRIAELTDRLEKAEQELNDLGSYRDRYESFKKRCQDYEQSLEEVGAQLRESRLEVESLKENSSMFLDSQWMDSKQVKQCALCQQAFSVTRRKHHCRLCGNVFCQNCSDNKMELASSAKPARVCDTCHAFLLAKFVKTASSTTSSSTT